MCVVSCCVYGAIVRYSFVFTKFCVFVSFLRLAGSPFRRALRHTRINRAHIRPAGPQLCAVRTIRLPSFMLKYTFKTNTDKRTQQILVDENRSTSRRKFPWWPRRIRISTNNISKTSKKIPNWLRYVLSVSVNTNLHTSETSREYSRSSNTGAATTLA